MNMDSVKKFLVGIPNVEMSESVDDGTRIRIFKFRRKGPNGKAYSTKIAVYKGDHVSIQCSFVPDPAVNIAHVGRYVSMLNTEFHQKGWRVTFLVEDGCVIASTGTSGEHFSQEEISKRLMLLLTSISQFDDGLAAE